MKGLVEEAEKVLERVEELGEELEDVLVRVGK